MLSKWWSNSFIDCRKHYFIHNQQQNQSKAMMIVYLLLSIIAVMLIYCFFHERPKHKSKQFVLCPQFELHVRKEDMESHILLNKKKKKKNKYKMKRSIDQIINTEQDQENIEEQQKHHDDLTVDPQLSKLEKKKVQIEEINKQQRKITFQEENIEDEMNNQFDRQLITSIFQEISLLKAYFLEELQEIIPFNGKFGHYKVVLQGTLKELQIQWKYHHKYPHEIIHPDIQVNSLNPLEKEILEKIIKQHQQIFQQKFNYLYIFNLISSIYQELLMNFNIDGATYEQQNIKKIMNPSEKMRELQNRSYETQKSKTNQSRSTPLMENIIKKQIYGEILNQIFYLHDLREMDEATVLNNINNIEENKQKYHNNRGRYITQFEELEMIGEGGFGKVYKVKNKLDSNIYAIKKIVINYADVEDRKLLKEVALLSKLNHPNIVRYHQSWLEEMNSIEQLIEDMSFTERSKINDIKKIYKNWQHQHEDIKFARSHSKSQKLNQSASQSSQSNYQDDSSSIYQYQDNIVFEGEENISGITFQDQLINQKSIEESSKKKHQKHHHHRKQSMNQSSDVQASRIHQKIEMNHSSEGLFPFKILYIAMEFCSGINLRLYINEHFHEEDSKIQIIRGMLEGLAYIHSKKIIHRDIKPANIFLTENNKVKIGDFGLATSEQRSIVLQSDAESMDLNQRTQAVGTGFYRAPEQFKSTKYDEKVDIYSIGIIMFELYYEFKTAMERMEILKQITKTHKIPSNFAIEHATTDIQEIIQICLKENPQKRHSASKLLQNFRNKYFTQLVSCIANPKHFQFYELLTHLFAIKNESNQIMKRDQFKEYQTNEILKIYQIHRGNLFNTLPFIAICDFVTLNGVKITQNRKEKFLMLSERGVLMEYSSNTFKSWMRYAKESMKRKKINKQQTEFNEFYHAEREELRRYTFEKIADFEGNHEKDVNSFKEKLVTAFDISYTLEDGFNAFYLYEMVKICESINLTLNLTQTRPVIYLSHSKIFTIMIHAYKVPFETVYRCLLSINQNKFNQYILNQKVKYFEEFHLGAAFSKKLANFMENSFDQGIDLLTSLAIENIENYQQYHEICYEIKAFEDIHKNKLVLNKIKWKLEIPPAYANGIYWQVGPIKGFTSTQQYSQGQYFCNLHLELMVSQGMTEADASLWGIGEHLQDQIIWLVGQCWKNGVAAKMYDNSIGEKEKDITSRNNIIFKKKNDRVQLMIRKNELQSEKEKEKQSSFMSRQQFDKEVIKSMSSFLLKKYYY